MADEVWMRYAGKTANASYTRPKAEQEHDDDFSNDRPGNETHSWAYLWNRDRRL